MDDCGFLLNPSFSIVCKTQWEEKLHRERIGSLLSQPHGAFYIASVKHLAWGHRLLRRGSYDV